MTSRSYCLNFAFLNFNLRNGTLILQIQIFGGHLYSGYIYDGMTCVKDIVRFSKMSLNEATIYYGEDQELFIELKGYLPQYIIKNIMFSLQVFMDFALKRAKRMIVIIPISDKRLQFLFHVLSNRKWDFRLHTLVMNQSSNDTQYWVIFLEGR